LRVDVNYLVEYGGQGKGEFLNFYLEACG